MMNWGSPVGMSPSTGTVLKPRLATVPVMSAARGPGKYRPHFAGHRNTIARVKRPIPKASQLGLDTAFGTSINAGIVPLPAGSWPNSLASCSAMMMQPIPLMKPDTTG